MKSKKVMGIILAATMAAGLTGCGGSSGSGSSSEGGSDAAQDAPEGSKTVSVLTCWDENSDNTQILVEATNRYNETNPETPIHLQLEIVAQDSMNQKLSVLAASNDLPDVFCTGTQEYIETYVEQGWLKSIDEVMNDFGAQDALAAEKRTALLDLTKQEALYVLPCDQSIEGIWYNTELFEQYDLEVPDTIDDFMEVCETFLENDVQPMVCPGKEKWPITRLIGSYATMAGGVDALVDANNGDLSWGDDVFLQAYSWLAEMGEKGYFGQGVTTVDTNTANSLFLSGKAAMYYNGSWFTSNLNSEENQIGENVGMFAFPTVDGGKGEANTFTTSYGMYWCFNSGAYDDAEGEWMAYLLKNYGDVAMELQGRLTAYTLSSEPEVDYYTNVVLEAQEKQTGSGVWPEYAMVTSVQDAEYSNAQMLILNQITPEAYGEAMDAAMSSAQ